MTEFWNACAAIADRDHWTLGVFPLRQGTARQEMGTGALDDGDAHRFERIVGDRRDAKLAVALGSDDPTLEERTLIDDFEVLAEIWREAAPQIRSAAGRGRGCRRNCRC